METEVCLDTHVVIWLDQGTKEQLSRPASDAMEESLLLVSPMVKLELEYLHEIGRIRRSAVVVMNNLQQTLGLELADDSFPAIIQESLSIHWTRDVFDRLIVAHARLRQVPLITKDRFLRKHTHCIW